MNGIDTILIQLQLHEANKRGQPACFVPTPALQALPLKRHFKKEWIDGRAQVVRKGVTPKAESKKWNSGQLSKANELPT